MNTKAFYCAGTHWDREWYEPFQEFRRWLVDVIDEAMDLLEKTPEYRCFHLDGQAVVVQDYLEMRPEQKDRLLGLLNSGRLIAGPWYTLPDEWLVSGESLIRNIDHGMRVCRRLGFEPMHFSYTPDQFGHIAALPMIVRGTGLEAGICWRGTCDEEYPDQFVWVGPDGSRMPTARLSDGGAYDVFRKRVRIPVEKAGFTDESYKRYFGGFLLEELNRCPIPLVLLLDATDHDRADPDMVRIWTDLKRLYPDVEFSWCSIADYGAALVQHADELPERTGELRYPGWAMHRGGQYLIAHTTSSRYPIKQRNDQCQGLVEKWAEPMALCSMMASGKPVLKAVEKAWEYLLRNHPHDSICGCSIDDVHEDMMYRWRQTEQLALGVVRRAMVDITRPFGYDPESYSMVVHNPLPFARKGLCELEIRFRPDWPNSFRDSLETGELTYMFRLVKKDGSRIPFQVARIDRNVDYLELEGDAWRHQRRNGTFYAVAAEVELPACGYTAFTIEPCEEPVRTFGSMMTEARAASNGIIQFALDANGSGRLGLPGEREYSGLFLYDDSGDAGDGWTRGPLMDDIVFRSYGAPVMTAIDEDGPLRTVFRVERTFSLPREMERRAWRRSADRETLRVIDRIHVEKGLPCLRVRTRVENTCKDHRFRVMFPTHIPTDVSFAETPFALVERDIPIPEETRYWRERLNPEKAFSTFCGVQDEAGGLAVLAPLGLHEYAVTDTPERALTLTLFRATFQTLMTRGEPGGQLLGPLDFEYLLWPFQGRFDPVRAARLVAEVQVGVHTHFTKELPDDCSFVETVRGAAVVTALKPAADGRAGVIRFWNPTNAPVEELVRLAVKPKKAQQCNLCEQPEGDITLGEDGSIPIRIAPRGLTTVRFDW